MKEMMASLYYSTVVPSVFAWVMIFRVMIWVLSWHVYLVPVSFLACPIRCEISQTAYGRDCLPVSRT